MKHLKLFTFAAALFLAFGVSAQQTKIGYIRIDDIVSLFPDLDPKKINLDTVGAQLVRDSILPGINHKRSEFERKSQEISDTTKPQSVRNIIYQDILKLQEELEQADPFIQQVLERQQTLFLQPYYRKAKEAIDKVAKAKGYTHVFSTDVFLVAPEADDLSEAVLKELNIPIPKAPTN